jgi:hypothetical protein
MVCTPTGHAQALSTEISLVAHKAVQVGAVFTFLCHAILKEHYQDR